MVRARHYDVVGFCASCERHGEMLAKALRAVRHASCNKRLLTMVGGPLFVTHPEIAIQLGADAVTTDGGQAPAQAAFLLLDQKDQPKAEYGHSSRPLNRMAPGEASHSDKRAPTLLDGGCVQQTRPCLYQENRAGGG